MSNDANVIGLQELLQALKHMETRYKEAVGAAIYQEACRAMADSLQEVPVDVGRLRQSHYVKPPTDLNDPQAVVGYGSSYGIYVHERTDQKHNPPTKDYFLSDPLARAMEGYSDRLAKRIESNVQTGVGLSSTGKAYPQAPKL